MSEPVAPTETETAPATGRGRPRPDETVERDGKVLAYLTESGPQTRKMIAEGTGLEGKQVYLSLYRLSRADPAAVVRDGTSWKVNA